MKLSANKHAAIWLAASMLAFSTPAMAAEVAYTLDPAHTETQFNWMHLGYSHPSAGFDDISGTLRWNARHIEKSSVSVSIPVASIHTHVPALDQELLSDKFFDAGKYPTITFVSRKVEPTQDGHRFTVTGDLTVHGVTKPVVLDVTLNQTGVYPMLNVPAMGFDATTHFQRSDFGIGMGVPMVSDDIQVRITTEALEAKGFAKAMKALSQPTPPQKK